MPRETTQDDTLNMDTKTTQETAKSGALRSGDLFGDGDSKHAAKLWAKLMLKAELFDYLCWLEDHCVFREAALDGQAGDYLVTASDGTTCWGKSYAEAVHVAMAHDKDIQDGIITPNASDEPRPLGAVGSGRLFDGPASDSRK